jgi:hypothetical protein
MQISRLAAVLVALPAVFLASMTEAAPPTPQPAAPPVQPAPTIAPTVRKPVQVRTPVELTMKNVAAVPGEKRTYEAVLKTKNGGAPVAKKKVSFRIEGKNGTTVPNGAIVIGSADTDEQGRARIEFSTPELAQGNYAVKATFSGDDQTAADSVEANLLVVKAIAKFELSDLIWGTYKNEPGPPYGTIMIKLVRDSDKQSLAKPVKITVNGQSWNLPPSQSFWSIALQPMNASSWNVKVQFDGDDTTIATGAERTYIRPK